jgi:hypothetical protein
MLPNNVFMSFQLSLTFPPQPRRFPVSAGGGGLGRVSTATIDRTHVKHRITGRNPCGISPKHRHASLLKLHAGRLKSPDNRTEVRIRRRSIAVIGHEENTEGLRFDLHI